MRPTTAVSATPAQLCRLQQALGTKLQQRALRAWIAGKLIQFKEKKQ